MDTTPTFEEQIDPMRAEWLRLLKALKGDISDDYRANEDDEEPGMCVTIGFTPADEERDASWSYQTGDNSYTGGCLWASALGRCVVVSGY